MKEGDSNMKMKISAEGINLIKSFEGLRLNAYKVSPRDKYYTIGYGHYGADVTKYMKITEQIATELLREDLAKAEKHVNSYDGKYHWTQNEYDALVSFAYNVGNIHQLTAFGTRSKTTIANKILQYTKSNGTVLQGLVLRRKKEQKMFLTPVSVSYETIAKEVIAGKWGNGSARRKALIKAGYDATLVQQLVNEMLR